MRKTEKIEKTANKKLAQKISKINKKIDKVLNKYKIRDKDLLESQELYARFLDYYNKFANKDLFFEILDAASQKAEQDGLGVQKPN